MKIYVVNKNNELNKIANCLEDFTIETKNDCKFKMTKNDYLIINEQMEGLDKQKNIFFITNSKEYKYIWNLVENYKTLDIIDSNLPVDYIVNRIKNKIKEIA